MATDSVFVVVLLTLDIVDGIGAIAVIAFFYSGALSPLWLRGVDPRGCRRLRRAGVSHPLPIVPLGIAGSVLHPFGPASTPRSPASPSGC